MKSLFFFAGVAAFASARPIDDHIKHVIIYMQENRAFDHYFGTLSGVRGFNDRTPIPLSTGRSSFYQPIDSNSSNYMLPFRTEANVTNAMCMEAPLMTYPSDMGIWDEGRLDMWNVARPAGYGMSYFTRDDLPYYYSLYDGFTVGDHYFQSVFSMTNPNRLHLFSGSNGLSVGQQCVVDNVEPVPGWNWTTVAEELEKRSISWRVYQQHDNFDDNGFAWFANFQSAPEGSALYEKGMKRQESLIAALEKDIVDKKLPTVSWVIAPTRKSEHATNHPCAGEDFTARILQVLQRHPETYKESLLILDYDEGGQFYDHFWTPTPPLNTNEGYASVNVQNEINTAALTSVPAPIGLGFRVPLLLVSPFTRGHKVISEVFDHTSVVQFLETYLNFTMPTISDWRRLITGDLTNALDFDNIDTTWPDLPDTSGYVKQGDIECHTLPDPVIPSEQSMPKQEVGTRIAKALPYSVVTKDSIDTTANTLSITLSNTGSAGIPLALFDMVNLPTTKPKQYALAVSDSTTVTLPLSTSTDYGAVVVGPNGFLREFRGNVGCAEGNNVNAVLTYPSDNLNGVAISVTNNGNSAVTVNIIDNAYHLLTDDQVTMTLSAHSSEGFVIDASSSSQWYDFTVMVSGQNCYYRRFMGHRENGKDSISDPAMSNATPAWLSNGNTLTASKHPMLPERITHGVKRQLGKVPKPSAPQKDAQYYHDDL